MSTPLDMDRLDAALTGKTQSNGGYNLDVLRKIAESIGFRGSGTRAAIVAFIIANKHLIKLTQKADDHSSRQGAEERAVREKAVRQAEELAREKALRKELKHYAVPDEIALVEKLHDAYGNLAKFKKLVTTEVSLGEFSFTDIYTEILLDHEGDPTPYWDILYNAGVEILVDETMQHVARDDNVDALKWLIKKGLYKNRFLFDHFDATECLKHLKKSGL